jgi:thioredoxin-related protein
MVSFVMVLAYYFVLRPSSSVMLSKTKESFSEGSEDETCKGTNKTHSLLFFYMDTCPHCIDFKPIWEDFRKQFESKDKFAKVCLGEVSAKHDALLEKYKVNSFPTVLLVKNDDASVTPFNNDRTVEELTNFINQNVS